MKWVELPDDITMATPRCWSLNWFMDSVVMAFSGTQKATGPAWPEDHALVSTYFRVQYCKEPLNKRSHGSLLCEPSLILTHTGRTLVAIKPIPSLATFWFNILKIKQSKKAVCKHLTSMMLRCCHRSPRPLYRVDLLVIAWPSFLLLGFDTTILTRFVCQLVPACAPTSPPQLIKVKHQSGVHPALGKKLLCHLSCIRHIGMSEWQPLLVVGPPGQH